jgi:hypothetical protein
MASSLLLLLLLLLLLVVVVVVHLARRVCSVRGGSWSWLRGREQRKTQQFVQQQQQQQQRRATFIGGASAKTIGDIGRKRKAGTRQQVGKGVTLQAHERRRQ